MNGKHTFTRRLFAGLAAAATLLAGGVFASTANAADPTSTYDPADDFEEGAVKSDKAPKLNVTKYLSNEAQGSSDVTGSDQDANRNNHTGTADGVVFTLQEVLPIKPSGMSDEDFNKPDKQEELWSTVKASSGAYSAQNTNGTYTLTGPIYYGVTGYPDSNKGTGKITSWYSNNPVVTNDGKTTVDTSKLGTATPLPTGHHLYRLHEVEGTKPSGYNPPSEDSIFDLPYRATNIVTDAAGKTTKEEGFVYNLSVFPKNTNNNTLHKDVKGVTDANGHPLSTQVVQAGDHVNYEISYAFAGITESDNNPASEPHKLYLEDLGKTYQYGTSAQTAVYKLFIADRLSSAFVLRGISNFRTRVLSLTS